MPGAAAGRAAAIAVLVLLTGFALALHGRLVLAQLVPWSGAIVLTNWITPGACFLVGIVLAERSAPVWRRAAIGGLLGGLGWSTVAAPLLAPAAEAGAPAYRYGVCVQTSPASCSAAAAAILLREHLIETSEREMAELCLTSTRGTPELGLYRGLRLKTDGTPWQVEVLAGNPGVLRLAAASPALLLVRIGQRSPDEPVLARFWPERNLANHAIVFYGFADDGSAVIGDPAAGLTRWTAEELANRWRGEGLRLVRR